MFDDRKVLERQEVRVGKAYPCSQESGMKLSLWAAGTATCCKYETLWKIKSLNTTHTRGNPWQG